MPDLFFSLAAALTIVFILVLILLPSDRRWLILITVTLINVISAMCTAPVMATHLNVGGHYAGVLLSFTNSIGCIANSLFPTITGYIVHDDYVRRSPPFSTSSLFFSICALLVKRPMEYYFWHFDHCLSVWSCLLFYI